MALVKHVYREVTRSEAPALHAVVEAICAEKGVAKPKICFPNAAAMEKPLDRFLYQLSAFVSMHNNVPHLVLGSRVREVFGYTNHNAVSAEFRSVIAHELAHVKHDLGTFRLKAINNAPYAMALVGMGAVFLSEKIREELHAKKESGASEEEVRAHGYDLLKSSTDEHKDHPMFDIAQGARVAAGGLLGLAAGVGVYTVGRRHMEFRADRFSAEVMQGGQPMIRGLRKVTEGYARAWRENPGMDKLYAGRNPWQNFLDSIQHPSHRERFKRLEAWTPSR